MAIITGAGGGIGRATAVELVSRGYELVLVGRTETTLEQTAVIVGSGLVLRADVTVPEDIDRIVEQTISRFGRLDLIVNNAGIAPMQGIEATSIKQFHAVMDTNLSAAFYLSKAAWPIFTRQRSGVIVNVSSMAAKDPFPGFAAYGAAKAGLNALGLSLAKEGAGIGVRVHTVAPGAVETGLLRSLFGKDKISADQAMDPADVATVIAQCASGDLRFTSGEVIWMHK